MIYLYTQIMKKKLGSMLIRHWSLILTFDWYLINIDPTALVIMFRKHLTDKLTWILLSFNNSGSDYWLCQQSIEDIDSSQLFTCPWPKWHGVGVKVFISDVLNTNIVLSLITFASMMNRLCHGPSSNCWGGYYGTQSCGEVSTIHWMIGDLYMKYMHGLVWMMEPLDSVINNGHQVENALFHKICYHHCQLPSTKQQCLSLSGEVTTGWAQS